MVDLLWVVIYTAAGNRWLVMSITVKVAMAMNKFYRNNLFYQPLQAEQLVLANEGTEMFTEH